MPAVPNAQTVTILTKNTMSKYYRIVLSIILAMTAKQSIAQFHVIEKWHRCLGGTGSESSGTHCIAHTIDGNYILAGSSQSNNGDVTVNKGGGDFWIVKLDTLGNILLQKSFGGSSSDAAGSVKQTSDKGYIIAGVSTSNNGDVTGHHGGTGLNGDFWIVKTDSAMNMEWQKSFGGSDWEGANSVHQLSDGNYIASGYTHSSDGDVTGLHGAYDYWILKLSASGNIIWQKTLGGSSWEESSGILPTTDRGFIVSGYSESNDGDVSGNHGGKDYWLVKLDSAGSVQWKKTYGGTGDETPKQILQTTDGGYFIVGNTSTNNNGDITGSSSVDGRCWLLKLNSSGNIQWQKLIGGTYGTTNWQGDATAADLTKDGGYVIIQHMMNSQPPYNTHGVIVKIDSTGNVKGNIIIRADVYKSMYLTSISQEKDYGFTVFGASDSYYMNGIPCGHGGQDWYFLSLCPTTADFSPSSNTACVGDTIILTNTSEHSSQFKWYVDNILLSTMKDTAIAFNRPGYHNITLKVLSPCIDSVIKEIVVNPIKYVNCYYCSPVFCEGDSELLFINDPSVASINWSTGSSNDSIFVHTSGTYYAFVTDVNGCSSSTMDSLNITFFPAPLPQISANGPSTFCYGDSVKLTSSISGNLLWNNGDTAQSISIYDSGIFQVTANYPSGCIRSSLTDTITAIHFNMVSLGSDYVICADSTTLLDAGSSFSSYLWSTGVTAQTIIADTGTYWVQVMDAGCPSYDNIQILADTTCITLRVQNIFQNNFYISPNPTNSSVIIQFNSTINNAEIILYDLYGQEIKAIKNISGDKIKINRDNLPSGIYFIRLTQDNKIIAMKKLLIID